MKIYQVIPNGDWGEGWYFHFAIHKNGNERLSMINPDQVLTSSVHKDTFSPSIRGWITAYLE